MGIMCGIIGCTADPYPGSGITADWGCAMVDVQVADSGYIGIDTEIGAAGAVLVLSASIFTSAAVTAFSSFWNE